MVEDTGGSRLGLGIVVMVAVLLAVYAVIAPVFVRTGGHGRKDTCQHNLKEIGSALFYYCADYDGVLPSSAVVSGSKMWSRSDYVRFAIRQGSLPPAPGQKCDTWAMLLYPYTKQKDTFWCPSDELPKPYFSKRRPDTRKSDPNATISYWYRAAIDRAWYGGTDSGGKWTCRRENDFTWSADQFIIYERDGWHWGNVGRGFLDGLTVNALFVDGHVKNIRLGDTAGIPERYDPTAPGEPGWFNCEMKESEGTNHPALVHLGKDRFFDPRKCADDVQ